MDEFQVYAILFTLAASLYAAWFYTKASSSRPKKNLPPSPPTLPVIGNLHQLGHLPHQSLRSLSTKYGAAMFLKFGSLPVLVISSSDFAREVLKTHDLAFAERPDFSAFRKVFYDLKDLINLQYGEQWRRLRTIFIHNLLGTARVKSFNAIMDEEVALLVESIKKSSSSPVNMTEMLMMLTNNMIFRAAFGKKHNEMRHGKKLVELVEKVVVMLFNFTIGEFVPWLSWINAVNGFDARLDRFVKEVDVALDDLVGEHLECFARKGEKDKDNFVDILLGIYKGNVPGVSIDMISVKAVILDVFGAGTETSATTLIWLMTELIRNPTVMKKLQQEVRGTTKGKQHITGDDIRQMPYLKAVIKETLRIHPPVAMYFRSAREYVNLKGYDIDQGTIVLINAWAIGRDPACWDQPERFMPERFLDSSVDYKGFDFHMLPFGSGRRICPGIGFAETSLEHTVANLMREFDWALPGGARGEDLDASDRPGLSIGRKEALIVVPSIFSHA